MKVFSSHYIPCIAYMQAVLNNTTCIIDEGENFIKQTYRNRTIILGANGPQSLVIPVHYTNRMPMHKVMIENSQWTKQHLGALKAAYGKSAFYFYYEPEIEQLYMSAQRMSLTDFNRLWFNKILKWLKVEPKIDYSTTFVENTKDEDDFRNRFNNKNPDRGGELIVNKPYLQVFAGKFPFEPNLSILDLLFAYGPASVSFLTD